MVTFEVRHRVKSELKIFTAAGLLKTILNSLPSGSVDSYCSFSRCFVSCLRASPRLRSSVTGHQEERSKVQLKEVQYGGLK